ncbi:MAG: DUF1887 family protein [Anaerolineae bacterium]|nr:DUF1887 family protein [Anaerolineae bacterium]
MTTLLSLIGEQPMPALLPNRFLRPNHTLLICTERTEPVARRISRLIDHSRIEKTDPYDLTTILARMNDLLPPREEAIVNLTGGTKMMMLAAFALATQRNLEFVYLKSEHAPQRLHRYSFNSGQLLHTSSDRLPSLLTASDYLNAHLPGFTEEGFSRDDKGNLTIGGRLEQAVANALANSFEVLTGVRPQGVANQIEIDLVIRMANQVGIAEVKLGGDGEPPKHGIDQLSTAGGRVYLGTYTSKFLITAKRPASSIRQLAAERGITLITLSRYEDGFQLEPDDTSRLTRIIRERLSN